MGRHEPYELRQFQALPLSSKIRMTKQRIQQWVDEFGTDGVYISFSGGKDSTVLLDIARQEYPNMKAAFIDTGLEYPEIRDFVKTFSNVDWIKPKMNFRQVVQKYGYPFIGKEVSLKVGEARSKPNGYASRSFDGSKKGSRYDYSKYAFLLDAPFKVDGICCKVMKKYPAKKYEKETGRTVITAQMACESQSRETEWLQNGCNAFDKKRPISNPMSFWTNQDVLLYIKMNNIPLASVYGDIVIDYEASGQIEGQMNIFDLSHEFGIFVGDEDEIEILKTTGCDRTGCMFCGFGCHLDKSPGRFERMKTTHPKQYDYIMRKTEQGGLNFKEVIDWINEHGNLEIKY